MKNHVILLMLLNFAMAAFAAEKGTKMLGGTVSLSRSRSEIITPVTELAVTSSLGYCVIDNLMIEVSPKFTLTMQEYEPPYSGHTSSIVFGIGVGARFFIGKFYLGSMFNYNSHGAAEAYAKGNQYYYKDMDLKAGCLLPLAKNIYLDLAAIYNFGVGEARAFTFGANHSSAYSMFIGIAAFLKKAPPRSPLGA